MKRIITAASAVTLLAAAAVADTHMTDFDNMIRSRDITGGEIYTMSADTDVDWQADTAFDGVGDGWQVIGQIEDVILDRSGQMVGIVGEIGGFLDVGDKHVFLPVEDIRLGTGVGEGDSDGFFYVTRYTEEQLEQLEGVDEGWWE